MRLTGNVTSLNKFISRFIQHALPFYKLMRKGVNFEWTLKCKQSFIQLKISLSKPLILSRSMVREKLFIYLAVLAEAVSVILVREVCTNQNSVYLISNALVGPKLHYRKTEKNYLALVISLRKL